MNIGFLIFYGFLIALVAVNGFWCWIASLSAWLLEEPHSHAEFFSLFLSLLYLWYVSWAAPFPRWTTSQRFGHPLSLFYCFFLFSRLLQIFAKGVKTMKEHIWNKVVNKNPSWHSLNELHGAVTRNDFLTVLKELPEMLTTCFTTFYSWFLSTQTKRCLVPDLHVVFIQALIWAAGDIYELPLSLTSAQHNRRQEILQINLDTAQTISGDFLIKVTERGSRVGKAAIKAKCDYLEESKI